MLANISQSSHQDSAKNISYPFNNVLLVLGAINKMLNVPLNTSKGHHISSMLQHPKKPRHRNGLIHRYSVMVYYAEQCTYSVKHRFLYKATSLKRTLVAEIINTGLHTVACWFFVNQGHETRLSKTHLGCR